MLEQAAMVDGCGFGRTYFRIMLPNAKGPMLITFLFTLVWYWSDFYTLSTYLSNVRTLSVSLASLRVSLETVLSVEAWDPYKIITMEQAACIASIVPAARAVHRPPAAVHPQHRNHRPGRVRRRPL